MADTDENYEEIESATDRSLASIELAMRVYSVAQTPHLLNKDNSTPDEKLTDILTSLRHYCHQHGIAFERGAEESLNLFAEEMTGTDIKTVTEEEAAALEQLPQVRCIKAKDLLEKVLADKQHTGVISCPQDYAFYIQPYENKMREAIEILSV